MSASGHDAEAQQLVCCECRETLPAQQCTVARRSLRTNEVLSWICKACNRMRYALMKQRKAGDPLTFTSNEDRIQFFKDTSKKDMKIADLQDHVASCTKASRTSSELNKTTEKTPHYTEAELRLMPRFQGEAGQDGLKILLETQEPLICKRTQQKLYPLDDVVLTSETIDETKREEVDETHG